MTDCLNIAPGVSIPEDELGMTFVRSSGPGGQNVNKVNTKAVLRWCVTANSSLPADVRQRFLDQYWRRISLEGYLIITSQRFRLQGRNEQDCRDKLIRMIQAVLQAPKPRKATRPPPAAVQRRLNEKKETAQKKQDRSYRPEQSE